MKDLDHSQSSFGENVSAPAILVGICSARGNCQRRDAVRETWMSQSTPGVTCRFFVGGGLLLSDEPDTIVLNAPDGYDELPTKVIEFFRQSLRNYHFDWLFKCDDDTYLSQSRLMDLITPAHDLVGNEFLIERGSPSGGAGYLLSRAMVEKLVQDGRISPTGAEDILVGKAAIRLGAKPYATTRLCWNNSRYPQKDNDVVTSHWCSPGRLRAIHANLNETPDLIDVVHPYWSDTLALFPGGIFTRQSTQCSGSWRFLPEGEIGLDWFDWGYELLSPSDPPKGYRCIPAVKAGTHAADHPASDGEQEPAPTPVLTKEGAPQDTVAVFLTTSGYGLPHIDSFLKHNPLVPVHVTCGEPLDGDARSLAWRNADRPIRRWWLDQGRHLNFKYALFLEWDVVFASDVDAIFPAEADFYCKDLKKPGAPWMWFAEASRLPESIRQHATGTAPLAVTRISHRCLTAMFSHPMEGIIYDRDIFCELRLPTLATACGFEPVECPGTLSKVYCGVVDVDAATGVWHAVKHRQARAH